MAAVLTLGFCPKDELIAKDRDSRFEEAVIYRKQLERMFPFKGLEIFKAVGGWFRVKGSESRVPRSWVLLTIESFSLTIQTMLRWRCTLSCLNETFLRIGMLSL